jgi:hypothetical protein
MLKNTLPERKGNFPEFGQGYPEFKTGSQFVEFGNMNALGFGGGMSQWSKNFIYAIEHDIVSPTILTISQKKAIDTFVKKLLFLNSLESNLFRPDNISLSKLKEVKIYVGGTSNSHKYNLVDPRDLDIAYRETYNGGTFTHNAIGVSKTGSGYIDPFITPSTFFLKDNYCITIYNRNNIASATQDWGVYQSGANMTLNSRYTDDRLFYDGPSRITVTSMTDNTGLITINNNNKIGKVYRNKTYLGGLTNYTNELATIPFYKGCVNNNGTKGFYKVLELQYASSGLAFTNETAYFLYVDAIEKLQYDLGRSLFF